MAMSKQRKRLMDRIRRKFKWESNTNYNRGTMLIKPYAAAYSNLPSPYVNDLSIYFNDYFIRRNIIQGEKSPLEIEITLTKYIITDDEKRPYIRDSSLIGHLTFEELELVYQIAKEKRNEIESELKGE